MKRAFFVLLLPLAAIYAAELDTLKVVYPKISPIECPGKLETAACMEATLIKAYIEKLRASGLDKDEILVRVCKKFTPNIIKDKGLRKKIKKKLQELEAAGEAKLTLEAGYIEFGEVKQSGGKVRKSMNIYNKGKADLVITNIKSLCKCTTMAYRTVSGISPFYGTDGSPEKLDIVIKPEEFKEFIIEIDLKDSTVTPGQLTRYVVLTSNDYLFPEGQIAVRAMVK